MYLFIFLIGLFVGSFLNVLIDRLPRNETVIKGRSHCEFCKKELQWYDLIPVLSFVLLRGKCRYCKKSIGYYYPIIELSTGILFAMLFHFILSGFVTYDLRFMVSLFSYLLIGSSLIVIFFTDLKYGIIPDRILLLAIVVSFMYLLFLTPQVILINLISGVLAFLFFLAIYLVFSFLTGKESMGGGDIKLAFLLGLLLGFPNIIVCFYLAFLTGALIGIILILWRKKSFKNATLPFGPFMVLGAIISLFWGNLIYLQALRFLGL